MKKVLFLLVLVMAFGVKASAQNHWDVKAGIGLSNFSSDDDSDAKLNWKVGAGYEFRINKLIGIEPSVFVNSKGTKYDGGKYSDDCQIDLVYLEVPVMCNFHVGAGWVLGAGVYVAGLMSKSDNSKVVFGDADDIDGGVKIGAKYQFDNGLFLGMDASYGCTDVYKHSDNKNTTAGVVIGYSF